MQIDWMLLLNVSTFNKTPTANIICRSCEENKFEQKTVLGGSILPKKQTLASYNCVTDSW